MDSPNTMKDEIVINHDIRRPRKKSPARPQMTDTLATIKEEYNVAQIATLSQMLAPRYMTRSRASVENSEAHSHSGKGTVDNTSDTTVEDKVDNPLDDAPSTASSTKSPDAHRGGSGSSSKRRLPTLSSDDSSLMVSAPQPKKRGRHKEYTAPTGVWKTNGGYISTIYVGNRRIYGPLRDNPDDAGVDRQKLIEAKSFVRNEVEMRSFISTLKASPNPISVEAGDPNNYFVIITPKTPTTQSQPITQDALRQNHQQSNIQAVAHIHKTIQRTRKPILSTITSIPTTIEGSASASASATPVVDEEDVPFESAHEIESEEN